MQASTVLVLSFPCQDFTALLAARNCLSKSHCEQTVGFCHSETTSHCKDDARSAERLSSFEGALDWESGSGKKSPGAAETAELDYY